MLVKLALRMKKYKIKNKNKDGKEFYNYLDLCKGCGMCIEKCPVKCLKWDNKILGVYNTPTIDIDIDKCIVCGLCELYCPDCAISVKGKKKK